MLYMIKTNEVEDSVMKSVSADDTVVLMGDGVLIDNGFPGDVYAMDQDCRARGVDHESTIGYERVVELIEEEGNVVNWG